LSLLPYLFVCLVGLATTIAGVVISAISLLKH